MNWNDPDSNASSSLMLVDYTLLSAVALNGLVEEFASRDGTDYGDLEQTLSQKKVQILAQLHRGEVLIVFDTQEETCNLVNRGDWQSAG